MDMKNFFVAKKLIHLFGHKVDFYVPIPALSRRIEETKIGYHKQQYFSSTLRTTFPSLIQMKNSEEGYDGHRSYRAASSLNVLIKISYIIDKSMAFLMYIMFLSQKRFSVEKKFYYLFRLLGCPLTI